MLGILTPASYKHLRRFDARRYRGMNRNELLLSLVDLSVVGLEIRPGYNPLVPKPSGRRIDTLDHATAAFGSRQPAAGVASSPSP